MKHTLRTRCAMFRENCDVFFTVDAQAIWRKNWRLMRYMTPLYLLCLLLFYALVCLPRQLPLQSLLLKVAIGVHLVLTAMIHGWPKSPAPRTVGLFLYAFGGEILLLTMSLGVFVITDMVALLFPLTMILMTQIYTLPPRHIGGSLATATALFLVLSYLYKPPAVFEMDMVGVLTADTIAVIGHLTLMQYKIEAFLAQSELRRMSFTDVLSKVMSRRAYETLLETAGNRVWRNVGVVFMDVNGLKRINDSQGHQMGDEQIRRTAELLMRHFPRESIYRISGDEFVVLCSDVSQKEFESAISRLAGDAELLETKIASYGAVWKQSWSDMPQMTALAESAMYIHKQGYYRTMETERRTFRDRV